nr:aldo/keto reductase [uncultured Neokomagataea sp.]
MSILRKTFPLNAETQIPAIGFGTYLIGEADVTGAVRTAIGVGYRHIDTAAVYHNGTGIRAALSEHDLTRKDIFVTTKLWPGATKWDAPQHLQE